MSLIKLNSLTRMLLIGLLAYSFTAAYSHPEKEENEPIIYVKASATGNNDGSSWQDAFTDLQAALSEARVSPEITEIWVAEGFYKPGNSVTATFRLVDGVDIFGGFEGTETSKDQRDWTANQSNLSGNIGTIGGGDNVWHVLTAEDITTPTHLDGLTVRMGTANGSGQDRHGAGLLVLHTQNLFINDCLFSQNTSPNGDGGAMYFFQSSDITISNVNLFNNSARGDGGAVYVHPNSERIQFFSCRLERNQSFQEDGGAVGCFGKSVQFFSSQFIRNEADRGGAVYVGEDGSCDIWHGTLTQNTARPGFGSAVYNRGIFFSTHSIYWDHDPNPPIQSNAPNQVDWEVEFSIVEGGWSFTGSNNLDVDPQFKDPENNFYTLQETSPGIDVSNETFTYLDLVGNPRVENGKPDMGAYEFQEPISPVNSILYVNKEADGQQDGTSWEDAFTDLQSALALANTSPAVEEIWVAEGTYTPTQGTDRSISFHLVNDVDLLGGFTGDEENKQDRNPALNTTILSGEIGNSSIVNNSWHVLRATDLTDPTLVDGFIIFRGYANSTSIDRHGAGIFIDNARNLTVENCMMSQNQASNGDGGAVYAINSSNTTFKKVTFKGNLARGDGGAIYLNAETEGFIIDQCIFQDNTSTQEDGGALAVFGGAPSDAQTLANSLFVGNKAVRGGAIYLASEGALEIANVTMVDNESPTQAGSALNARGMLFLTNSILWANSDAQPLVTEQNTKSKEISFSLIEGGFTGDQILDEDPQFLSAETNDYSLSGTSPAIDIGQPSPFEFDLLGNPRNSGTGVDLGAYEFQLDICSDVGSRLYVDVQASGLQDGSSWNNAFTDLQLALATARTCEVNEIWVAEGTYKPVQGLDDNETFLLVNGVSLYGGFSGSETSLTERDWKTNLTILSGALGQANNTPINSKHVVVGINIDSTTIIDGFIIRDGSTYDEDICSEGDPFCTDGIYLNGGGGMLIYSVDGGKTNPIIQYCRFENNFNKSNNSALYDGGGLYIQNADAIIQFCEFLNNYSGDDGGALYIQGGKRVSVLNSIFRNNNAQESGGAIYAAGLGGLLEIENCEFYKNLGNNDRGGAILANYNKMIIRNSTFLENLGTAESTTIFVNQPIEIYNSIIWGRTDVDDVPIGGFVMGPENILVSNSIVEGGWPGTNISSEDPLFVDVNEETLDLSLQPGSPAINIGLNAEASSLGIDIAGNPRISDEIIDLGAYEFQAEVSSRVISFLLIDSDTDNVIGEVRDGDILTTLPASINIEAVTSGEVNSVRFQLSGPVNITRTENVIPWALFGDNKGDFRAWNPFDGSYSLTATPYSEKKAQGEEGTAKSISFSVDISQTVSSLGEALIKLYPNPNQGSMLLRLPNDWHSEGQLNILNKEGETLYKRRVSVEERELSVEMKGLQEGVYYLLLKGGNRVESTSFIITN
ncbi:MAG: choice-of-anchor Q domain-containing protein [Bacteroidota bacterium]